MDNCFHFKTLSKKKKKITLPIWTLSPNRVFLRNWSFVGCRARLLVRRFTFIMYGASNRVKPRQTLQAGRNFRVKNRTQTTQYAAALSCEKWEPLKCSLEWAKLSHNDDKCMLWLVVEVRVAKVVVFMCGCGYGLASTDIILINIIFLLF